jgi:hypothetical protein
MLPRWEIPRILFAAVVVLSLALAVTQLRLDLVHNAHPPRSHQHPPEKLAMSTKERTYIMVKPDGVQRGLVGNIIARFEGRGFKLIALKLVHATPEHLEKRACHPSPYR